MKANKLTKETILDLNTVDRGFPEFTVGDTIEVAIIVKEGSKERLQMFLGDVICMKKSWFREEPGFPDRRNNLIKNKRLY